MLLMSVRFEGENVDILKGLMTLRRAKL